MGIENVDCRCCGCAMNHADVRQLALYYHNEDPSMVAVQYLCPRCGTPSWRHFDPADLAAGHRDEIDWLALAEELGLAAHREGRPAPSARAGVGEWEPSTPIALDEVIDFSRRISALSAEDLRALADSVI